MTRKIPIISLKDFEAKAKKPVMMKSLVSNIKEGVDLDLESVNIAEGIEDKLESVNVAEIKNHDIILSVPKSEWKSGLENAMNYYIEREEYETCSKIKKLIEKL